MGVEHSRHRSPLNVFVHILSCLAIYSLDQHKVNMSTVRISKEEGINHCRGDPAWGVATTHGTVWDPLVSEG